MDGHFAMWHYFVVFAKLENALPAHLVLDHVEQTKVAVGRGWRARATGEGEREREREREREKDRKKGEIRARTMVPQSPPTRTTTARGSKWPAVRTYIPPKPVTVADTSSASFPMPTSDAIQS